MVYERIQRRFRSSVTFWGELFIAVKGSGAVRVIWTVDGRHSLAIIIISNCIAITSAVFAMIDKDGGSYKSALTLKDVRGGG